MAKKQRKAAAERLPSKRQLSKWQREEKIRRIVIISSAVFLAGIFSWVGYGYYQDYKSDPSREVVIEVNGVSFTMGYFVDMLDIATKDIESTLISSWADYLGDKVADEIINAELFRQAAKEELGIEVTSAEIDAELTERKLPNSNLYRSVIGAALLQDKLREYYGSRLPATMEQSHVEVVLVESEEVATELLGQTRAGGNFSALVAEFSCNSAVQGDLGWLPKELMPNPLITDAAFNVTPGEISQPICDNTTAKNIGYWLIEVTEKRDNEINARVVLLGSKAEAERAKADLARGNFTSVAEQYSQHESKDKGGELGWLKQGDMGSTAFDQVAFNISVNEVSDPVPDKSVVTPGGCWLVNVVDRGEHELEEETKEKLIDRRLNDWLNEWRNKSTIDNFLNSAKKSWAASKVVERR
ncbi:MAG: peptidylprolyl isomerase [Dehalococcoidia bacterium]